MPPEQNRSRSEDNVSDGNGKKKLPADVHELVVAKTGKCAASPDVKEKEDKDFCGEPEDRLNKFVDGRQRDEAGAHGNHDESDGRENEFAPDVFVLQPVVDDPETKRNQGDAGNVVRECP